MVKRINVTNSSLKRISDNSKKLKKVDPDKAAKELGASKAGTGKVKGGAISVMAIRQGISELLETSGGRPGLKNTSRRQKIPMSNQDWQKLQVIAEKLTSEGVNVSAGQVASIILNKSLKQMENTKELKKELSQLV